MLEHLLDPDTTTTVFPHGVRSGRIALVRGFDVASREFRGAIGDLTKKLALRLLDVPSAPAFGAIPAAEDVKLVVVARRSLLSQAERCAAYWGAPVLGPAVANSIGPVLVRSVPGLRVTTDEHGADGVAARLAVSRPVSYRIGGGPRLGADSFGVEPSNAGILVQAAAGGQETLRVAERPVEFHLQQDTEAVLDGHPVLLPAGGYLIESRPEAFHRILPGQSIS